MDGIAREGERAGKIMSQRDKPRQGVVANTQDLFRNGAVGFIDRLRLFGGALNENDVMFLRIVQYRPRV
jgi:hypothetical protein